MRTEQEIKIKIDEIRDNMFDSIMDYSGRNLVSLRSSKNIINSLRWCLEELKEIEPTQSKQNKRSR